MIYILLVFAHVGVLGSGNSNSVTTQEFLSKETCEEAARIYKNMSGGTTKQISAFCVKK